MECVAALPLELRASQVLMPAVYGDRLADAEALIDEVEVGGLILMTWPSGADADRLRDLKSRTDLPLLLSTDEEGGNVQRLRSLGALPSARDMATSLDPATAERTIADHARAVRALGIDVVFAPVLDVGTAAPIGNRSFGDDPAEVAAFGAAYARGWLSAGITPVVKHFPGHGRSSADTHVAPGLTPPLDELRMSDLVPYRELATLDGVAVMVGHLEVPGLTDGLPATLSPAAVDGLLRSELGYEHALVFTDGLGMGAVGATHNIQEAAVASLAAGVDVMLYTDSGATLGIRNAIVDAVVGGRLPATQLDDSVARILDRKGIDPCGLVAAA